MLSGNAGEGVRLRHLSVAEVGPDVQFLSSHEVR